MRTIRIRIENERATQEMAEGIIDHLANWDIDATADITNNVINISIADDIDEDTITEDIIDHLANWDIDAVTI